MLVISLLLLSLVPAAALGQEGDGGIPPLQSPFDDGFAPEPVYVESEQDPVDIPDVKEVISGKLPGEGFGGQVAGVGDVDNDGYDDMAVLVPLRGYCVVYHGGHQIREASIKPLAGTPYPLTLQSQVRPAGDIDFDGFDDVLMRSVHLLRLTLGTPGAARTGPPRHREGHAPGQRC
ncbi:MAG: integrin alpha [Planctomycetota bacterium]